MSQNFSTEETGQAYGGVQAGHDENIDYRDPDQGPQAGAEKESGNFAESEAEHTQGSAASQQGAKPPFATPRDSASSDDHGNDSNNGFSDHGSISDRESVCFAIQLFGRGTAGHDAVKSGNRAARDNDEQEWEHRPLFRVDRACKEWGIHDGTGDQNADKGQGDAENQNPA